MSDHINPEHHKQGSFETIDILRGKLTKEEFEGFLKGNIIKYLLRSGHKPNEPTDRDYKKTAWYANMLAGNEPRTMKTGDEHDAIVARAIEIASATPATLDEKLKQETLSIIHTVKDDNARTALLNFYNTVNNIINPFKKS